MKELQCNANSTLPNIMVSDAHLEPVFTFMGEVCAVQVSLFSFERPKGAGIRRVKNVVNMQRVEVEPGKIG